MPHLILYYTSNIDPTGEFGTLFLKLHTILNSMAGLEINSCKGRVQKLNNYFIASGESEKAFIHLDVHLFEGKPAEIKKRIGQQFMEIIRDYFSTTLTEKDIQITVEIKEIKKELYFKYPDPPQFKK
jgi:5-carboxymethyl-2-hydroxymuconate isomerase